MGHICHFTLDSYISVINGLTIFTFKIQLNLIFLAGRKRFQSYA